MSIFLEIWLTLPKDVNMKDDVEIILTKGKEDMSEPLSMAEDKLVQLKIKPTAEKIQTSHTSETKNA